jgi:hypothetical protein
MRGRAVAHRKSPKTPRPDVVAGSGLAKIAMTPHSSRSEPAAQLLAGCFCSEILQPAALSRGNSPILFRLYLQGIQTVTPPSIVPPSPFCCFCRESAAKSFEVGHEMPVGQHMGTHQERVKGITSASHYEAVSALHTLAPRPSRFERATFVCTFSAEPAAFTARPRVHRLARSDVRGVSAGAVTRPMLAR